jgi:hypothetical protein
MIELSVPVSVNATGTPDRPIANTTDRRNTWCERVSAEHARTCSKPQHWVDSHGD